MVLKTPLITAQKPILDIANSTRSPLLAFTLPPIKLHFLFGSGPAGRQQPPTSACTVAAGTAFVVMSDDLQRVASTSTRASAACVGDILQLSTRVRDKKNGRVYCCQMQDL